MIAKIKTKNKIYETIVFGFIGNGFKTKAIVFNEDFSSLKIIKYWNPDRRVFMIDSNKKDWIDIKNFEGYAWIYENLNRNSLKKDLNPDILEKCKQMQDTVKNLEWHIIVNLNDLENLDACAINFHDAYVEKICKDNNKQIINFSACDCYIILELSGEVETNLYEGYGNAITEDGYWDGIFESKMFFEDGFIYWVNNYHIKTSKEIFKIKNSRYFKTKSLKWKVVID